MKAGLRARDAGKMSNTAPLPTQPPRAPFGKNELPTEFHSSLSIPSLSLPSPHRHRSIVRLVSALGISLFPFSSLQLLHEQQLDHQEYGSHHDGGIGEVERVPVIAAEVNIDEVDHAAEPNAIDEI